MNKIIKPQKGPQEDFLSSSADIVIYGGAAGGGKTFALLLEALRHIDNGAFSCVIFRKETVQIGSPGGLWDQAMSLYSSFNIKTKTSPYYEIIFPSGAVIQMRKLNHDTDVYNWQGSQITLLCFDELTHFSFKQFFYMLSRNRSVNGIKPYVRATCNPDEKSWVADFISWYIDQKSGFFIKNRSSVIRYFTMDGGNIRWANTSKGLIGEHKAEHNGIKSLAFIGASIFDNKILLEKDKNYINNLKVLPTVERERLLEGNWKIKENGSIFKVSDFLFYDSNTIDRQKFNYYITSDFAVSRNKGDYTVHSVWGIDDKYNVYLIDVWRGKTDTQTWINKLIFLAQQYKPVFCIGEKGTIEKAIRPLLVRTMEENNFFVKFYWLASTKNKVVRSFGFNALLSMGKVFFPRFNININGCIEEMKNFPYGKYDDFVDTCSLLAGSLDKLIKPSTFNSKINKHINTIDQDWYLRRMNMLKDESGGLL